MYTNTFDMCILTCKLGTREILGLFDGLLVGLVVGLAVVGLQVENETKQRYHYHDVRR